jgi:RNA polymerase sigma-70 factor (family 1)
MKYCNEDTLERVSKGDEAAFTELYHYFETPAHKYCYSLLRDEEESENMVQEVFIKIWEKRSRINPKLNFNSYLFTCLRNQAFDHLKKMEKNNQINMHYAESEEFFYTDEDDYREARIVSLYSAIDTLSLKRKEILRLNIEEGLSYQEIAEKMSISKNTVKNQLLKAKQHLREKISCVSYG